MNDVRLGKVYAALFLFFLSVLAVGGYILTIELTKDNKKNINPKEVAKNIEKTLKIDENEDYIYFSNKEIISESHEIEYQDIVINIDSNDGITTTNILNNEVSSLKETIKKISEEEITDEEKEKIVYKEDDIYSLDYRKYTRYFYENYASLLVENYSFDCFNGSNFINNKSYVFNIETGLLISNEELLEMYNLNLVKLKERIQEKLIKDNNKKETEIDISSTLNNLDNSNNYALYINKSGFLTISYLVKTNTVDYNDVIILN